MSLDHPEGQGHEGEYKHKQKGCNINIYCNDDGHHKKCECAKPEFGQAGTNGDHELAASPGAGLPGGALFMNTLVYASDNLDFSNVGVTGEVMVNRAGLYDVSIMVTAGLNPLPAPLEVWSVACFLNGALIPQSCFSEMTLSPDQQANGISGDFLVHLNVGDKIMIANTSDSPLFVKSFLPGSNVQPISGYIKLRLEEEDYI